jgi:hypothetical protein
VRSELGDRRRLPDAVHAQENDHQGGPKAEAFAEVLSTPEAALSSPVVDVKTSLARDPQRRRAIAGAGGPSISGLPDAEVRRDKVLSMASSDCSSSAGFENRANFCAQFSRLWSGCFSAVEKGTAFHSTIVADF